MARKSKIAKSIRTPAPKGGKGSPRPPRDSSKPAASKAVSPKPTTKPAKPKAPAAPTKVAAITHKDSRVNIPTEDLRDFYHRANPRAASAQALPAQPRS